MHVEEGKQGKNLLLCRRANQILDSGDRQQRYLAAEFFWRSSLQMIEAKNRGCANSEAHPFEVKERRPEC